MFTVKIEKESIRFNSCRTNAFCFHRLDKTRNPGRIYNGPTEYGTLPPKLVSYGELCPAPNCPSTNCSETKCKDTLVNLYDLVNHFEMKPFIGTHYVGLQNRTLGMFASGKYLFLTSHSFFFCSTCGVWTHRKCRKLFIFRSVPCPCFVDSQI